MKRIYVAIPMAGVSGLDSLAMARRIASHVSAIGGIPMVPHDIPAWEHKEKACPTGYGAAQEGHTSACWLRGDLVALTSLADAIVIGPGWEQSVGVKLEMSVAAAIGIPIYWYMGRSEHSIIDSAGQQAVFS